MIPHEVGLSRERNYEVGSRGVLTFRMKTPNMRAV